MENTIREIRLCKINEISVGEAKSFVVEGREIGVFNVDGKLYAIDNLCVHAGAPLSEGSIDTENCRVFCGWHGWAFDLATGKCTTHPRQDVFCDSYPIIIKNDEIYIKFQD